MKKDSHSSGIIKMCLTVWAMLTYSLVSFGASITNNVLTIGNEPYTIGEDQTLIVKSIILDKGASLIINGTLRFEDMGTLSDFKIEFEKKLNGNTEIKIENNGTIECKDFTQEIQSIQKNATYTFKNNGVIKCEGNFTSKWNEHTNYVSTENAKIEAKNITFEDRAGREYKGSYIAEESFTIDNTNGNIDIDITITSEKFDVKKLILSNNIGTVTVGGEAKIDTLDATTTNVTMTLNGMLTLGYVEENTKLSLNGTKGSILSLCDKRATPLFKSPSTTAGTVIYLQNNDVADAWKSGTTPIATGDLQNAQPLVADNTSTKQECLSGVHVSGLLPIEITSFTARGSQEEITLEWELASEKDYKTIVVEYSKNGTDWREIDQVDGMGTTSFATQYSSIVTNDFPQGFLYFRLKEITFDGIESVSHTIVYENTPSNQSFKSLQYGHLNILYNENERRYVKQ